MAARRISCDENTSGFSSESDASLTHHLHLSVPWPERKSSTCSLRQPPLCGKWHLITDWNLSSFLHVCLIISGAHRGPQYFNVISFPLSCWAAWKCELKCLFIHSFPLGYFSSLRRWRCTDAVHVWRVVGCTLARCCEVAHCIFSPTSLAFWSKCLKFSFSTLSLWQFGWKLQKIGGLFLFLCQKSASHVD